MMEVIGLSKRMSITLTDDLIKDLNYLAESQGISINDAINMAITTEAYIKKHCMNGGQVLLKKNDDSLIQIVFR